MACARYCTSACSNTTGSASTCWKPARIPLNQGICGAAASSGKTIVVDDVSKDPRYLACSLETKSEIVVPVFVQGQVAGELDIDSHFPAAFGREDQQLVQYCAELVGKKLESPHP